MALSDRTNAAASTTTTGRESATAAPARTDLHTALPRAVRALRNPSRGMLQAQLRGALSELAEDMYRSLAGRDERPQPRAPLAEPQEQARQLRAALAAAQQRDLSDIAANLRESGEPDATPHHSTSNPSADTVRTAEAIRHLEEQRDQLTRVLHHVTGRCEASEADVRRLKANALESEERHARDAAEIARLSAECRSVRATYDWTRERLDEIENTLTGERATLAQELTAARAAHRAMTAALEAEQQRAVALESQLAATRAIAERQATQLASLAADHGALQRLLTQIVSGLGSADEQLRVLLERQRSLMAASSPDSTAASPNAPSTRR